MIRQPLGSQPSALPVELRKAARLSNAVVRLGRWLQGYRNQPRHSRKNDEADDHERDDMVLASQSHEDMEAAHGFLQDKTEDAVVRGRPEDLRPLPDPLPFRSGLPGASLGGRLLTRRDATGAWHRQLAYFARRQFGLAVVSYGAR
jgi:hypothetical protein